MGFDDSIKKLEDLYSSGSYKNEKIRRELHDAPKLRRTFAVLLILKCARLGEISERAFATRKTIYSHLYQLIELGLVKKVAIMDLWNKKKIEPEYRLALRKFKDWTSQMAPNQVRYFAAKTHYFMLTEVSKTHEIADWVLKLELEFKNS